MQKFTYEVIDSTQIIAIFDFTDAPHGLYDVKVINPNGQEAIVPYRYLVERAIEPDIALGMGGPRVIGLGATGLYGFSIQSLTNVDTPYVYFEFGVPELGINYVISTPDNSGLPYLDFSTNLRGSPEQGGLENVPWAGLLSEVNTWGEVLAPGYIFDLADRDFTGLTFTAETYPGLKELLRENPFLLLGIPHCSLAFQFHIVGSATVLTGDEFVARQSAEALALREQILADENASSSLMLLAADANSWVSLYLVALEDAGLLRPEDQAPSVREDPLVISLMATLSAGILAGPAGQEIITDGDLVGFFEKVRQWYGHNDNTIADLDSSYPVIASLPDPDDYNLQLSSPNHFEAFNIYVPFGLCRLDVPPSVPVTPLDFASYFNTAGTIGELATIIGPVGFGPEAFLPVGIPLPYTIRFENDAAASSTVGEVQILTELDPNLDPRSFRLGDLQLGDIQVHIPSNRGAFQGDFDFSESKGFILRLNAGIDLQSGTASWIIQAIDPDTGEVIQNPDLGLLPPNDADGSGSGFVTYTVKPKANTASGTEITAQGRVLFNTMAPLDTNVVTHLIDGVAPVTTLTQAPLSPGSSNILVQWNAADDENGSGLKHVTVYVAEDGGDFKIWLRQTTETSAVYEGQVGHTYEFLALAMDNAGSKEKPSFGVNVPNDDSTVNLGGLPTVPETTAPGLGEAPDPSPTPSTNPLFLEAQLEIPASELAVQSSEFGSVLRPFNAGAFATGIGQSHAGIGPMAIVVMPDGAIIISGSSTRSNLYRFSEYGDEAGVPIASLPYPVFDMALDDQGRLWAATGGGPLLQLDPDTGAILKQFADGLTQTLAIDPDTGLIYISSSLGIEIFDPSTEIFTHFSDVRVGNMEFSPSGQLWAAVWPNRGNVVRFNEDGVAELMLHFDMDVDSIAFGFDGSDLEGLLFISNNNGSKGSDGSELIMVDLATLQHVSVAAGGSRGDIVIATPDGKVLLSQSNQVDVLKPAVAPMVLYTNPPPDSGVALPRGVITVTFDQDMLLANPDNPGSVLNTSNYRLFGQNIGFVDIQSVVYDSLTKTAVVTFDGLMPDQYIMQVLARIQNIEGAELQEECISHFTAVSDFSSSLEIEFLTVRSDRQNQTVSYNVRVTNISGYDLVLPVLLVLDPAQYFDGLPLDADYQGEDMIWLIDLTDSMPVGGILQPGQSTNGYTVAIQNPTGQTITFEHGIFTLPVANEAPVFDSLPVTIATAEQSYQYQVLASDPDGLLLTYLLYDAPDRMTVETDTGLVVWEPTSDSPSTVGVILRVYDLRGGYATQEFSILVNGGNRPPVLNPIAAEIHGYEGQPLQVIVSAVDPDGDSLIFWADNLPPGAVFDTNTHALQWVPESGDAGTYENVTFIVSDGVNRLEQTTTILIAPTNQAPILIVPSDRTAIEGQTVRFQLSGYDSEGHEVTFSSNAVPAGAVLDPNTGLFRWTIGYYAAGEYEIPFIVSDGELSSTGSIKITVTNVNAAPEFFDVTGWQIYEGQTIRQRVFSYDPDNPAYIPPDRLEDSSLTVLEGSQPSVTYSLSALPSGAAFDYETWMFEWTPTFDHAGDYIVTFTATDDGDGTGVNLFTSIDVPITILNFNRPPEIADISNQQVNRGEVLEITVNSTDPDGDLLVLTAENAIAGYPLPDFAAFTDNSDGTATLRFEPDFDHRGDYVIRITATDDGNGQPSAALSNDYTFVVSVLSPNETPRMSYIGDKVAVIGQTLEFTIYVSDLDQDPLTFDANGLVAGASLAPGPVYGTAIFSWSPGIVNVGSHVITFRVTDSGNGDAAEVLSDEETINIIVRGTNAAPVLSPVGDQITSEAQELSVILSADDPDGDALTYYATNLPAGAEFDPAAGILTWSPGLFQAGIYQNIVLGVTDGNKSSSETITITVNNTNQAPVILSLPEQWGQEGTAFQFTLSASDIDGDVLTFSSVSALPAGATFDSLTGKFQWTPDYEQTGTYSLQFMAEDTGGLSDTVDISIIISNVNRLPSIEASNHAVALGQLLSFFVVGSDPDLNTTLTYSAYDLPDGASLDSVTGQFDWTPGPGQTGDYVIIFAVSDGESIVTATSLIRAALNPEGPVVTIELTPSFPVIPGQSVLIHPIADSLAEITSLTITVDGNPLVLDAQGRAEFIPAEPGRFLVEAVAADADGRIGTANIILKVRDPDDSDAPVVSFGLGLDGTTLTMVTDLIGTVNDLNLDSWVLELERLNSGHFEVIADGNNLVINGILAVFEPGTYSNGFYRLRLTAKDITGRESQAELIIEAATLAKPTQYLDSQTDLAVLLDGQMINIVRMYDSLDQDRSGTFGFGWRLANRDVDIQTDVSLASSGQISINDPYRIGTRLYLTVPESQRVGFTFVPQRHEFAGIAYYTPAWEADPGVTYSIQSAHTLLMLAGSRLYDLRTAQPYNPASGAFGDHDFTLTAPDGTIYHLSADRGVEEQITPDGTRFIYSDAGIVGPSGRMIQFVKDGQGRISSIIAPDGTRIVYTYDDNGNLVSVRNLVTSQSSYYAYTSEEMHLLTLTMAPDGSGSAVNYDPAPQELPIKADLGTVNDFNSALYEESLLAGLTDRYTFILRDSEIASTLSNTVLLGMSLSASSGSGFEPAIPVIPGLSPLSMWTAPGNAFALYAIEKSGLELIEISGADAVTSGQYQLELFIAGDVNLDGLVDGIDYIELTNAIGSVTGNISYIITADPNRDGIIDQTDSHILLSNYDFTSNQPPVITPEIFITHEDMEIMLPLSDLAQDAEHDKIYFRVTNSSNGTATLTPDGRFVRFVPDIGFTGTAGFELTADDGYAVGTAEVMTVEISGSPLLHIDFESRNPRLEAGQIAWLSVFGDFTDQQDVPLPASYLVFASTTPLVASVNSYGQVTALSNGSSAITVSSHGILAATAVAVGLPTDQAQLLIYADGVDVVPQSVSIVPSGGVQQLFVTMPGDIDITDGVNGTLYFIGNPAVANVGVDGLITAVAEGVTEVTVINGAAEAVIPVKVTPVIAAPAIIGSEGGIVEDASGALISIAPGGLLEDTTISFTLHDPAALTWLIPYPFELVAGFDIEIGDDPLWVPAQLAVPVGAGVADGTEVVFCQFTTIEDGLGSELSIWIEVDRGIVSDGMALTQTTLMQGVLESGSYMVASAPAGTTGQVKFELSLMHPLSPLSGGFFAYFGASTEPPGSNTQPRGLSDLLYDVGSSLIGGGASSILYGSYYNGLGYGYMDALAGSQNINMIELVPPEVLPDITTTNVNIDPDVVTEFTAIIDNSMVPADHPGSAPLITSVHFSFEDTGAGIQPTVTVDGERLLGDELKLLFFEQGSDRAVYVEGADLIIDGDSISAALPQKVALGLCVIQTRKTQTRFRNVNGQRREETYYVWSNQVSLNYSANYAFVATAWPGELVVMNAQTYDTVAQLPLEDSLISPSGDAFDVMITPDGSRAYVLLRNSLAVVDAMALQRIDTIWQTSHIDNIMLPEGADTDSFTIDPTGDYIYVSDVIQSVIYQISVNPADTGSYNTCVALFNLSLPVAGLRGLDVTSDGKRLYVAAPYSYVGWNGSSYDGKIVVVDIDRDADPDGFNIGLELGEINLGYHKKPTGINADSGNPYLITYTDMKGGFGLIVASENDIGKVEREILIDNEGMEIAILPGNTLGGAFAGHSTYAFVTGFKSEINRPDCPVGGNIIIIKDPFKAGAKVVGFTRPIPDGLPAGLAVSPDGQNLYVAYQRPYSVFVFSIPAILEQIKASEGKTIDSAGTPRLSYYPVNNWTQDQWLANAAIDVKADYRMDVPFLEDAGHDNTFQVHDENRAPISLAGSPWGIAVLKDVDTELKPVVDGLGDHLFFKNGDSFTFNLENDTAEGVGSGGNIVFLIDIEGPYKQFISFSVGTNEVAIEPSEEIVFAPQEQLKLTVTMKDIIAKNCNYDQLFGAVITIKAFAQRGAQDVLFEKSMCIIRFVSATDPSGYTRYARFMKTLNDGPDKFVREKTVEYHLPQNMETTFQKGTTQWDSTDMFILPDGPFVGEDSMVWKFDPTENGSRAMELRLLIDGTLRNTGPIVLHGTAIDRSIVSVDVDGFMSELAAFLLNDDYFDGVGANGEASNQFKSYFAGILPTDWFVSQEAFLERIATEGILLLQKVQNDFYRFENRAGVYSPSSPDGMAIQIVANNDDIPVEAQEVTSVWGMFTPPDPGKPAYTPANSGPFGLASKVDQHVSSLETYLQNVNLSPAAVAYSFTEFHNFWTTVGTAGPEKLNVWFSIFVHAWKYENPAISFATYCANTVSHELAHTFGVDEAYYAPTTGPDVGKVQDVPPKDIMRAGSKLDPDLDFAWMHFQTLMAAAGIAPNEVDAVFRDTIKKSAKNFLLPEGKNGIAVNIRILETAQEPYASLVAGETLLFPDGHLDFGTVVADGIGGDSFSMEITLFNDGRAPLTVSDIELARGGNGFSLADIPTDEFVLDIGQTIIFTLLFDPGQTGSLSDSLIVYSDAVDSPQLTIQLEGVGLTEFGRVNVDIAPEYASGQPNSNLGGLSIFALPGQAEDFITVSNSGGGPLSVWLVNVAEGAGQFEVSGLPAGFGPGNPIVLDSDESFSLDLTYSFSTIGLQRGEIQVVSDDPLNPLYSFFVVGTGIGNINNLDYGSDYVAVESGGIVRRFISDSEGNFNVRLSPGTAYHLVIFDPVSGLIGHGFGTVGANGRIKVTQPLFAAGRGRDSDGDGLPDDIEFAIGSSTDNPDTNFDGLDDFESVAAGINPVRPNFNAVVLPGLITIPSTITSLQVQESPGLTPPTGPSTPQSPPEDILPNLPQPQHFQPEDVHVGIRNGDFSLSDPLSEDFGWNIHGGAYVSDGFAVLSEDSMLMTRFSQTFMLSADVKELRFTIIGIDLDFGDKGPSDAFEMALLDANTRISLLDTSAGLTQTDSLMNIQYNGQACFGQDVTLPAVINSGDVLISTGSFVVKVALQNITEDTIVTLYFDLLGFAPFSGVVSIDDVVLITEGMEPPTAEAAGPYQGWVDVPLVFDASGSSDTDGEIILYEWDWDSDGAYETSGMVPTAEHDWSFDYSGIVALRVTDTDGLSSVDIAEVDIQVLGNIPPSVDVGEDATIDEGTQFVQFGWLSDSDIGDNWTAVVDYGDGSGIQMLDLTGMTFELRHTYVNNGSYEVVVIVTDSYGATGFDTLTLTVDNVAPVADDDAYAADEDVTLNVAAPGVLGNDSDVDGDSLTAVLDTDVANGSLTLNADGSLTYAPNANFNGSDSFTYTVSDGNGGSDTATVTITIAGVNDAPVAANDEYSVNEDNTLTVVTPGVLANDSDVDGDVLTILVGSGDASAVFQTFILEGLPLSFVPEALEIWVDGVRWSPVESLEGRGESERVYTVDVDEEGRAVVRFGDGDTGSRLPTGEGNVVTTYRQGAGHEHDNLMASVVSLPSRGILILDPSGSFTYTPDANFSGVDSFTYIISDGQGGTDTATVAVNINEIVDLPQIETAHTGITVSEGDPATNTGTFADVDQGDLLEITVSIGTIIQVGSQSGIWTWSFATADGPAESQIVTITATDSAGLSTEATFDLIVNNVAPTVDAGPDATIDEGTAFVGSSSFTDPGADTWTATVDYDDGAGAQPLALTGTTFNLNHDYSDHGIYTATVTITDKDGGIGQDTLIVTVNDLAPTAALTGETTLNEGQSGSFDARGSTSAPDSIAEYKWDWNYDGENFNASGDTGAGQFHVWNDPGTYTVAVQVTDEDGSVDIAVLAVEVHDITAPVVTVDALSTTDQTPELSGTVDDAAAIVVVTVGGQTYTATNHGTTWTLADNTISPALVAGTYDVSVLATDAAGNVGMDDTVNELHIESASQEPQLSSDLVSMQASGLRYNRRTGVMSSYITITNTSSRVISGDVHFVINSLSDTNVSLVGGDGTTATGQTYYNLTPCLNDGRLDPGESVTIRLDFYNPLRRRFTFEWDLWGRIG